EFRQGLGSLAGRFRARHFPSQPEERLDRRHFTIRVFGQVLEVDLLHPVATEEPLASLLPLADPSEMLAAGFHLQADGRRPRALWARYRPDLRLVGELE